MLSRAPLFVVFLTVSVTVVSAQKLRVLPSLTSVKLGDNVTLECATLNSETATGFVWFHEQVIVFFGNLAYSPSMKRYKLPTYGNQLSRLTIVNVQFEDHGVWECEGSFGDDPKERTGTRLSIKSPPQWLNLTKQRSFALNKGRSLTLNCSAHGDPTPTVIWTGDTGSGGIILQDGSVTEYYIGNILNLANMTDEHRGRYFCQASNGIGPSIGSNFLVNVPFSPVVTVHFPTVRAPRNHTFQLGCVVRAYPQVRRQTDVSWYFGQNQITNGEDSYQYSVSHSSDEVESIITLITPEVDNSVIGEYRCVAMNTQGRGNATIRLEAGPSIKHDDGATRSGVASMSSSLCLVVTVLTLIGAKL